MWDLPGPGIELVSPALGTLYHREVPKYIHFKNMFWFVYKLFLWKLLSGKWVIFFFINWLFYFTILYWFCHTLTWIYHECTCVPHSEPPPTSLSITSLWILPVHKPRAPCIMHQTWTGDSFHIWYFTRFNAILPYHPTLALSHRVQKTVQYICVSFAVLHTGLLSPSF